MHQRRNGASQQHKVQGKAPVLNVFNVEPNHVFGLEGAPLGDLPGARDAGLDSGTLSKPIHELRIRFNTGQVGHRKGQGAHEVHFSF